MKVQEICVCVCVCDRMLLWGGLVGLAISQPPANHNTGNTHTV